jgi:multicomponent Na+:H+ antiporter subunit B
VRRGRQIVGSLGVLLVAAAFAWACTGLHAFGHGATRYGEMVARATVPQRAATNAVAAVTFDFRGFDTLGEEFILFIAVVGASILLRTLRSEASEEEKRVEDPGPRGSEFARWLGAGLVGPVAVLAAYIVTHGALTPGGGFQGGAILMAAVAAIFVGGEYAVLLTIRRSGTWLDVADALGAAGLVVIGFGGLIAAGTFFQNFIDKGTSGLLTGGIIPLANITVGLEVAGALLMVAAELLDQRLLSTRT